MNDILKEKSYAHNLLKKKKPISHHIDDKVEN